MLPAQATVCGKRRVWSTPRARASHQRVKCSDPQRYVPLAGGSGRSTPSGSKGPREQRASPQANQAPRQKGVWSFLRGLDGGQGKDKKLQDGRASRQGG